MSASICGSVLDNWELKEHVSLASPFRISSSSSSSRLHNAPAGAWVDESLPNTSPNDLPELVDFAGEVCKDLGLSFCPAICWQISLIRLIAFERLFDFQWSCNAKSGPIQKIYSTEIYSTFRLTTMQLCKGNPFVNETSTKYASNRETRERMYIYIYMYIYTCIYLPGFLKNWNIVQITTKHDKWRDAAFGKAEKRSVSMPDVCKPCSAAGWENHACGSSLSNAVYEHWIRQTSSIARVRQHVRLQPVLVNVIAVPFRISVSMPAGARSRHLLDSTSLALKKTNVMNQNVASDGAPSLRNRPFLFLVSS